MRSRSKCVCANLRAMRCLPALILASTITLGGCTNEAESARERYEIVERNGTRGELCKAAKEVADAYLRQKNENEYKLWQSTAGIQCQLAQFDGAGSPVQDNETTRAAAAAATAAAQEAVDAAVSASAEHPRVSDAR